MTGGAAAVAQAVPLASLRSGVHRCPSTGSTWPAVEVLCQSMLPGGGDPFDHPLAAPSAPGSRGGASAGGGASGRAAAIEAPAGAASDSSEAHGAAAAAAAVAAPAGGWLQPGVRARAPCGSAPHASGAAAGGSGLPGRDAVPAGAANAEQQTSSSGLSALAVAPTDGSAGASC